MSDLVEFLRARLDEDEAAARACPGPVWEHRQIKGAFDEGVVFEDYVAVADDNARDRTVLSDVDNDVLPYVLRFHPARVLAEVEAKRRMVQQLADTEPCTDNGDTTAGDLADDMLRLLASAYRHHPEYRQEWKP